MAMSEQGWVGGRVGSHAELDLADEAFWAEAGPAARFAASIELSLAAWSLRHPDEPVPRFGRDAFGVRKLRRSVYLRHFPRHVADEVLGLLGIHLDAWQVAIEGWTGVMVDGEPKEREAVAVAFGVVFPQKLRELEDAAVTLESMRASSQGGTASEGEEMEVKLVAEVAAEATSVTLPEPPRSFAAPLRVVTERETWGPCEVSSPDETLVRPVGREVGPALPFQAGSAAPSAEAWARLAANQGPRVANREQATGVDETVVTPGDALPSQPLGLERLASLAVDLSQPGVERKRKKH